MIIMMMIVFVPIFGIVKNINDDDNSPAIATILKLELVS